MKIPLSKAVELLQSCSAVIVDDNAVTYPSIRDDEDEFLVISWETERGDNTLRFEEEENREVFVDKADMFLTDTFGDEIKLTLLQSWIFDKKIK